MTDRRWLGAALAAVLVVGIVGCESVPGEGGGPPPAVARSAATPAGGNGIPVPEIDIGTFGIYQVDPATHEPYFPYPVGWAWRPEGVPGREIWLLYHPDQTPPDGWRSPGRNLRDVCLRVMYEGDFDPPGTHWQDGIDQADYDAFREWIDVEYQQRWPQAHLDPGLFEVRDHQLQVH